MKHQKQFKTNLITLSLLSLFSSFNSFAEQAQEIINEGLPILNVAVDSMNMDSDLVGPWLNDTIHCLINKRRVHKYPRFTDGLHPNTNTCSLWAKKLINSVESNIQKCFQIDETFNQA